MTCVRDGLKWVDVWNGHVMYEKRSLCVEVDEQCYQRQPSR